MTGLAWLVVIAVLAAAAVDWWAVLARRRDVERWAKPASSGLVLLLVLVIDEAEDVDTRWFLLAAVGWIAGDLLLFQNRFRDGLAAFAAAYALVGVGFAGRDPELVPALIGLAVAGVIMVELGRPILEGVRVRERAMLVPVAVYIGVMGVVVAMAFATGIAVAAVGAALLAVSDGLIGRRRYVDDAAWYGVTIMATYHLGLILLVTSLTVAG